jgi:hypothetical protein
VAASLLVFSAVAKFACSSWRLGQSGRKRADCSRHERSGGSEGVTGNKALIRKLGSEPTKFHLRHFISCHIVHTHHFHRLFCRSIRRGRAQRRKDHQQPYCDVRHWTSRSSRRVVEAASPGGGMPRRAPNAGLLPQYTSGFRAIRTDKFVGVTHNGAWPVLFRIASTPIRSLCS